MILTYIHSCLILIVYVSIGVAGMNVEYSQRLRQSLIINKTLILDPSDATCSGQALSYQDFDYQYAFENTEISYSGFTPGYEQIQCSDTCPKVFPVKYVTDELIGSNPIEFGSPGCTDLPEVLRAPGIPVGYTGVLGTIMGPATKREKCVIGESVTLSVNPEDTSNAVTYTVWIKPKDPKAKRYDQIGTISVLSYSRYLFLLSTSCLSTHTHTHTHTDKHTCMCNRCLCCNAAYH